MKNKWDAVFFDFDGVILDSVDVKTRAFAAMFRQYGPEVEKAVIAYHLTNGGMSRFKKFEYYYNQLLNKAIDQEQLDSLGQEFNRLALQGVLDAQFMPGVYETLQELQQFGIPAFVVSGTPQEEIQLIVEKRRLGCYFVEVHGSPRTKHDIIQDIAGRHSLKMDKTLFIGDAMTDFEAAKASGVHFLGIVKAGDISIFPEGTTISATVDINLQQHNIQSRKNLP